MTRTLLGLAAALLTSAATIARADEPSHIPPVYEPPPADVVEAPKVDPWVGVERPWLYTPDSSSPPPLHAITSLGVGMTSIDKGAARPFAADTAHEGAVFDADVEFGLTKWASVEGQFLIGDRSNEGESSVAPGGLIYVNVRPLPANFPIGLVLDAGYLRELGGANGVWGRVGVDGKIGRFVHLGSSVLISHVGATAEFPNRDGADVMITAAATVSVARWAQIGVENVVQDLEEITEGAHGDDGGTKDFVGPTATLLLARRVQIMGGPAIGLGTAPRVLGRVQAIYMF